MLILGLGYTVKHMRILEPKQLKSAKPKRQAGVSKTVAVIIVLALVAGASVYGYAMLQVQPVSEDAPRIEATIPENDPFSVAERPFKELEGDGFKQLYQSIAHPNTQEITDPPAITGNRLADARIRSRAEARGYRLSRIPMGAIIKLEDEPRLDSDDLLQPLAAEAWYKLRDAARREGYPVSLLSAYRSPDYQRDLFLERLYQRGVSVAQLASGAGDAAIDATLEMTAVPGYSRHHTGYTIDLWCEDGSTTFVSSSCYRWISKDGYRKAMEFGWIPSYPEGATEQGPEPEPWEYVWVGSAVRQ